MTTTHLNPEVWNEETFAPYFQSRFVKANPDVKHGIMTLEQVKQKIKQSQGGACRLTVLSSNNDDVVMFTDDHCWGGWLGEKDDRGEREYFYALPKDFVPCSFSLPTWVVPRPGVEDGNVTTIEQWLNVFHEERILVENMDQLLHYLNVTRKQKIVYRKTHLTTSDKINVKVLPGTEPNDDGDRTCFKYKIRKTDTGHWALFYKHGVLYRDGSSYFHWNSGYWFVDPVNNWNRDKRKAKREYNRTLKGKLDKKMDRIGKFNADFDDDIPLHLTTRMFFAV